MSASLAPVLYRLGLKGSLEQSLELVTRSWANVGSGNVIAGSVGYSVPNDHFLCLQSFACYLSPVAPNIAMSAGLGYTFQGIQFRVMAADLGNADFAGGAQKVGSCTGDVWIPPGAVLTYDVTWSGGVANVSQFALTGVLCPRGNLALA